MDSVTRFFQLALLLWTGCALGRAEDGICANEDSLEELDLSQRLNLAEKRLSELETLVETQRHRIDSLEKRLKHSTANLGTETLLKQDRHHGDGSCLSEAISGVLCLEGEYGVQPYDDFQSKTLLRYRKAFYNAFKLLSVVRTDGDLTTIASKSSGEDGSLREFFFLGDSLGKIYVFSPYGDLLTEHNTGNKHSVVDLTVYTISSNKTGVTSCHADGEVRIHVLETHSQYRLSGNQFPFSVGCSVEEETISDHCLLLQCLQLSQAFLLSGSDSWTDRTRSVRKFLVSYEDGQTLLLKANGTIVSNMTLPSRLLAVRTGTTLDIIRDKDVVLMGHREGVSVYTKGKLKHLNCTSGRQKLDLQSFAFDVDRGSRAFAVSAHNQLLTFTLHLEESACKVRHRNDVKVSGQSIQLQTSKGYLMMASTHSFAVMNTTIALKTGPRDVLIEPLSYIADAFNYQIESVGSPLMAVSSKGDVFLALYFSDGIIAVFQSNLFTHTPVNPFPFVGLYRIVFVLALIGVLGWRFWRVPGRHPIAHQPAFPEQDFGFERDQRGGYRDR